MRGRRDERTEAAPRPVAGPNGSVLNGRACRARRRSRPAGQALELGGAEVALLSGGMVSGAVAPLLMLGGLVTFRSGAATLLVLGVLCLADLGRLKVEHGTGWRTRVRWARADVATRGLYAMDALLVAPCLSAVAQGWAW